MAVSATGTTRTARTGPDETAPRSASSTVQASWLDNQSLVSPAHQLRLDEPLLLDGGRTLPEYVVNFETYGTLSAARDNAILVCHSLTSRAHAAGRRAPDDPQPGWWDAAIGPGKMLDTQNYFVICADALGAGHSTGPASPDPETGRRYGISFPVITVRDMVRAQHRLVQRLGIERLHAVIGGCLGGQQALEWAIAYPGMVRNAVVITTTPATSAHTIAIFSVMRHLIRADPQWQGGDYYGRSFPVDGLNAAVAAAVPLWMSREAMETRFGRRSSGYRYTLGPEFAVEAFIGQLVAQARHELDPNGLMYLMRAVEYFDLERQYGGLEAAFKAVTARTMFVSYRQDWRYPAAEAERMREAITAAGGDARHLVLDSAMGHGAFLYEVGGLAARVSGFLGAPVR
jgi:homoserine O-acetyltransferase